MKKVTFKIGDQFFFNNGDLILPLLKDKSDKSLEKAISEWLCQDYSLVSKKHKTKAETWDGFNAKDINIKIRSKMSYVKGLHGETHIEYRCLFHTSKEGFDFSLYDEECNYHRIRNTFIGEPGMYKGEELLGSIYKKLRIFNDDKVKLKKKDWDTILAMIGGIPGENVPEIKDSLTIVGEIQFGNWALAKHDLFRLINANAENSIDYYIYIAPTGTLAKRLSNGIVTFDKIVQAVKDNHQIISTPMWVIGLDIK